MGLLQARTGNSRAGFLLMAVALILSGLIMLGIRPPVAQNATAQDRQPQTS